MIVEQAPVVEEAVVEEETPESAVVPVVLSARGEGALRGQAARLLEHVRSSGAALVDVGFSSVVSRAVLEHRAVIT
ncbi:hypothetical protein, partial [Streptomyces sp. DT171]|uniref:CurL C-terminal domain-containing protein n=1 Tax=Streptomyces sp. DT171 TaxID=3416524 RepID=UPI003CE7E0F3